MPKKKTTKPDDALALLQRRKESRDAERERRKADANYQAEWRDAWLATVATDPERLPPHKHHDGMVQWSEERGPIIQRLASVVQDHGFDEVVGNIAERIKRWLQTLDDEQLYNPPVASVRPLSGGWKDESYVGFMEDIMACALVLKRAFDGVSPLVPDGLDTWHLRSDAWSMLGEEVSRAKDLPIDPVPHVPKGRCGNGHEWIIEGEVEYPIRCPTCEKNKQEAKRKAIDGFVYRMGHLSREIRDSTSDEPEVYFKITTLNDSLVFHASQAGLCELSDNAEDIVRRVIKWAVGTLGKERQDVLNWPVADAIERLKESCGDIVPASNDGTDDLQPGETTVADAVESSLTGNSLKLFRRLRQNRRFVSFDTLRNDVWNGKNITDRGIESAIERLKTALLDTRFSVELDAKRAKLGGF